jgi:lipopolysaccharide export system permease protein
LEQIAYGMLRTHRSFSRNGLSISVTDVDERRLIRPTITFPQGDDGQIVTITADEAELQSRPERNALSMLLLNSFMEVGSTARISFPGIHEHEIPIGDTEHDVEIGGHPAECALRQIPTEIVLQQKTIQQLEQQAAANAAFQLATGDFSSLTSSAWSPRRGGLMMAASRLNRLRVEPWRRWANGFSCTAFVLVGIPLAIRLRTADVWTSFGLCFLPILILYYPLLAVGLDRAKAGVFPPYCVWIGNVILVVIGWWLFRKPRIPWKGSLNEL